jgi:hypothetical protein
MRLGFIINNHWLQIIIIIEWILFNLDELIYNLMLKPIKLYKEN